MTQLSNRERERPKKELLLIVRQWKNIWTNGWRKWKDGWRKWKDGRTKRKDRRTKWKDGITK